MSTSGPRPTVTRSRPVSSERIRWPSGLTPEQEREPAPLGLEPLLRARPGWPRGLLAGLSISRQLSRLRAAPITPRVSEAHTSVRPAHTQRPWSRGRSGSPRLLVAITNRPRHGGAKGEPDEPHASELDTVGAAVGRRWRWSWRRCCAWRRARRAASPKCFGKTATIVAGKKEKIKGTRKADVIYAARATTGSRRQGRRPRLRRPGRDLPGQRRRGRRPHRAAASGRDDIDGGAGDDRIEGGAGPQLPRWRGRRRPDHRRRSTATTSTATTATTAEAADDDWLDGGDDNDVSTAATTTTA